MPKVTWIKPKVNELAALFRAYRTARKMTSTQIAEKVGCTPQNARVQMNKPGRDWNKGQLLCYCDALGIPYAEAMEAAIK
jgi:predicted transcriptional regulator